MSKPRNIVIITKSVKRSNQRSLLISNNSLRKLTCFIEEHQEQRSKVHFSLMENKADSTNHWAKIFNRCSKDTNIPKLLGFILHNRNTADLVCDIKHESLTESLIVSLHVFRHNQKNFRHRVVLRPALVGNHCSFLFQLF